ncbi:MAG: flippase-like domain-containing protein [Aquificae bacterium]|nr:flippase-like domain-containing protein [Aquificota bacterium]
MKRELVKYFELAVSLLITIGFIYLFYAVIGFEKFVSFFTQINPLNILTAFLLYVASYITRALRWKITLSINDFWKLFKITAFNTVFNIFMPFRTGEVSFFYMLKKENIPISESAVSFVSVRIFDAISLFAVFGSSYLIYKGKVLPAVILLFTAPLTAFLLKKLSALLKSEKISRFREERLTPKNIAVLYLLSVITFILKFTAFYLVLPEGIDLPFVQAVFAASAGDITTILPIHGIAGIGTYEGGYAGALILLGVDREKALLASVFAHIFMLAGAGLVAGFSYLFIKDRPTSVQKPD